MDVQTGHDAIRCPPWDLILEIKKNKNICSLLNHAMNYTYDCCQFKRLFYNQVRYMLVLMTYIVRNERCSVLLNIKRNVT